ncbi:hypothetical protein [Sporosarcina psychrophila]|uniref:Transglycosylase n=1 Tax=Sporosarcina psychrophila TaxID=1476 RepID=A0ABV2KAP3_SPOPS
MTNKPIAAHCDAGCKKEFTINKFRTKKVKNGIEKNFFKCLHCKHEYVAYYASAETLKLQKEMRKLHTTMSYVDSIDAHNDQFRQEAELKAMIKQSMDDARAIAEGK